MRRRTDATLRHVFSRLLAESVTAAALVKNPAPRRFSARVAEASWLDLVVGCFGGFCARRRGCGLCRTVAIWADEIAFLAEQDADFFLQRLASKNVVQGFTTNDAVRVVVLAAIGTGNDARITLWQGQFAEKAEPALLV